MGIRVRLCSDWCLREADILSDYPQTSVSCIVRTQYPYFAQRYAGITGFGPILVLLLNFYSYKLCHPHLHPDPGKPHFCNLLLNRVDMQIVFHIVKGTLLPKLLAFHGVGEGFADGCGVLMIIILV